MVPASFKLTPASAQAIKRLGNTPLEIRSGARQGLADHALKVKRGFQAAQGTKAKGLRYEDPVPHGDQWVAVFKLRYIAAWLELGTRAHRIVPRALGRARLDKRTGRQNVHALTSRQKKTGGGKRALATPKGPRALARVSGIKARRSFEQYLNRQTSAGNSRIAEAVTRRMSTGR